MFDVGDINSFYLDIFKEIGNIGAGNAATSLSKLINKKVNMEVPRVKTLNFYPGNFHVDQGKNSKFL